MATSARRPSDYGVNGCCDVALVNSYGRSARCWCERYRAVLIAQKNSIATPFGKPVGSSQEPFRHEAERIGALITQSEAANTGNFFARRSGLGPVASRRDLTPDRLQAGQSKRTFIRRRFSSVHFDENLAAIRHRAQEPNDVPLKGEASSRLRGSPALFNKRLFVDPVNDLHLTIRGLFPGARRGNDQLGALGTTMNGERGRGVLRRRRARRRQRSNLRPVVNRRCRLADNPVRAWWLHWVGCGLLQEFVDALQPLHAFIF